MPVRLDIEQNAPIETWLGLTGRADHLARPQTVDDIRSLLAEFSGQPVRVLGDAANLLVDDDGVDGLVISLEHMSGVEWPPPDSIKPGESAVIPCEAGANLPKFIIEAVRCGLAGVEGLAGIPATIGGAVIMNAGGAFGCIADVILSVSGLTRAGDAITIPRSDIAFSYRHSGLKDLVITGAEISLRRVPPESHDELRGRLKEVMARKKQTQPLREDSAGCAFKNAMVDGERVSAGRLIDESGCKGLRIGGAHVSDHHANFILTDPGCTARDVIELMDMVIAKVHAETGIRLDREIVVWQRRGAGR